MRKKIYYDLNESDYIVACGKIRYYFSSEFNMLRFINKREEHQKFIRRSLSERFNIEVNFNELSDVVLYHKIEKRGSLMRTYDPIRREVIDLCQETIRLDGVGRIRQNYQEQLQNLTQKEQD